MRGYVKWDDLPASPAAGVESILRANQIARTAPRGPTYVCLDAGDQERKLEGPPPPPALDASRHRPAEPATPSLALVKEAARRLLGARRPVILVGRSTRDRAAFDRRVRLAERLNARVVTDLRCGASFPTGHPSHPYRSGIYIGEDAVRDIGRADFVLSLDWIDLLGTLRQAGAGSAFVVHVSPDQHVHNGWSFDHLGLPPADLFSLASPDAAVSMLLEELGARAVAPRSEWRPEPRAPEAVAADPAGAGQIPMRRFAEAVASTLAPHNPCYIRLPIGWPGEFCDFRDPLDYLGYDGGGGVGSGPGMAVGAALALRDTDRLPVAVIGDGDFLMGATAIWTSVRYGIPLLIVVANNASFFNDELHQERVALMRGRPPENRSIGIGLADPVCDLAAMAQAQGAEGAGPIEDEGRLRRELEEAARKVRGGGVLVLDARVAPGYGAQVSRGLMKGSSPDVPAKQSN